MTPNPTGTIPDSKNQRLLAGITIMITRALEQASEFASELVEHGARIVACPTIEIVEPESYALLDEAIENLYGYDWIIFTSVNGVDYFLQRFTNQGHEVSELDDLKVCAIGEATADRLIKAHVHVDLIPTKFKAEGVFEALVGYVGEVENLRGQVFLMPRAAVARDYLPKSLESIGARVDIVPTYRTVRPDSLERGQIEAMLTGGAIDCVTFTSSSTVSNFAQLFDTTDLSQILKGVTIACIGDITSNKASEYGLTTHIRPIETTIHSFVQAIVSYYRELSIKN
jgi:uroporphyrinogen III methyltransferase / synthase